MLSMSLAVDVGESSAFSGSGSASAVHAPGVSLLPVQQTSRLSCDGVPSLTAVDGCKEGESQLCELSGDESSVISDISEDESSIYGGRRARSNVDHRSVMSAHASIEMERFSARRWSKPVDFLNVGLKLQGLYGRPAAQAVLFASRAYIVLRRLMELHERSSRAHEKFDLGLARVTGCPDMTQFQTFVTVQNESVSYRVDSKSLQLPVSILHSCLLLRLHRVDSIDDPVQRDVRNNILACSGHHGPAFDVGYLSSVLRGVLIVHATRRYEYSVCLRDAVLDTRDNVYQSLVNTPTEDSLKKSRTTEGHFLCGKASEVFMVIAKSNVMDTFEGGEYYSDFCEIVKKLSDAIRDLDACTEDAVVLDFAWERIKNWKGFGGRRNEEGRGCSGFVAKNVVYQGIRNVMHALGFSRGASTMFVSGPNPCKLASVYFQQESVSRGEQMVLYREISRGIDSIELSYAGVAGDLKGVDFMILQDNLCKLVEVLQTTTTGRFFGKARERSLEVYAGVQRKAG